MSSQGVVSSKQANNNPGLCPAEWWCLGTHFFFCQPRKEIK